MQISEKKYSELIKKMKEVSVDNQVILQLMVKKGITTREEVAQCRKMVMQQPKYSDENQAEKQFEAFKKDLDAFLSKYGIPMDAVEVIKF